MTVSRDGRNGMLVLNSAAPVTGVSGGKLTDLNLQPKLYLGGFPGSFVPDAGIKSSLHGAIQRVRHLKNA